MDKTSIMLGYLVCRQIAGQRRTQEKQPVAYLYNGVRLPALPELDREMYPYVAIVKTSSSVYVVQATATPLYTETNLSVEGKQIFALNYDQNNFKRSTLDEIGAWKSWMELPKAYFIGRLEYDGVTENVLVWADHNVLNADSSIYLSASDPIPVYE